ncbi:hypothetical protein IAR55_004514 [Kwoniella newhampshirensis]|uniref:DM2 domain-containing protein n=1 Tax=Kwoniella newhampshirensis TaxID=1651941 RepID=A0AAW0Z0R7_9TREE
MTDQYVRRLTPQIRQILESSDLSTVSAKAVRKQLVARGEDESSIKASRSKIDEVISEIYDSLTAPVPAPESLASSSSDEVTLTSHHIPKTEPQSSQPEPLRATTAKRERKPSFSPSDVSEGETDEQMARRLQMQFDGEGSSSRPRPTRAGVVVKKRKKTVVKKKKGSADVGSDQEGEVKKKKRRASEGGNNTFNKELILSDALSDLVGTQRLSRPQVVKHIWDYVKERGLQDQTDKRYILCDEKLFKVFHTERLHMFTMNKILVDHVRNPDEVIFKEEQEEKPAAI